MSKLNSELRRMADDAARQARPPAASEIIRQGDRRRQRSLTCQSLGAAAGVAGAGVALGLGLTAAASPHEEATIHTAAFTLVRHANGTATLTINANVLLEPGILQSDLEQDGIPAKVTVGSFCLSDPLPAGLLQVVSGQPGQQGGQLNFPGPADDTITINPAAMPAGTELSFGNFRVANGEQTYFTLIETASYTCNSTASARVAQGIQAIWFRSSSSQSSSNP